MEWIKVCNVEHASRREESDGLKSCVIHSAPVIELNVVQRTVVITNKIKIALPRKLIGKMRYMLYIT